MQKPFCLLVKSSLAGLLVLGLLGCDTDRDLASQESQADQSESAPAPGVDDGDESAPAANEMAGWKPVSADALTEEQQALADYAGSSAGKLGQRLMGTVLSAAEADGFAAAVEVCHSEAEPLAAAVADEQGVAIGRTSTKLRNIDNQPPEWAREHVAAGDDERFYAVDDEGALAAATPIHLGAPCMNCHGTKEDRAPGVDEALDTYYPDDEARGYDEGDLRGWFWVEVPADAVASR